MIAGPNVNTDWRDSLYALNSATGFNFIFNKQIRRDSLGEAAQKGSAAEFVQKLASAGNPVAMELIGADALEANARTAASEKGVEWLRLSAASGNPVAMQLVAEHSLATDSGRTAGDAQSLLEQAAFNHFLPAQVALATYLLEGPLAPNASRAMELLRDAAARGSRLAHVVIATSLIAGRGLPVDQDAGVGWLRRLGANTARKIGALGTFLYARALASRFAERRRLTNYAAVLFEESMRGGNRDVEVTLAYLVRRGEVAKERLPSLDALLERLLAAGDPHALINQALRLAGGVDCAEDWRAADALVARIKNPGAVLDWYQPRAFEGDAEGHLVVAWLARHGLGSNPSAMTLRAGFDKARGQNWGVPDWLYSKAGD